MQPHQLPQGQPYRHAAKGDEARALVNLQRWSLQPCRRHQQSLKVVARNAQRRRQVREHTEPQCAENARKLLQQGTRDELAQRRHILYSMQARQPES